MGMRLKALISAVAMTLTTLTGCGRTASSCSRRPRR